MVDCDRETAEGMRRSEMASDPFDQFAKWFKMAEAVVPKLPNAMTLATVSRVGKPSARVVLLKGFDESGFVFFTNYESRKATELDENPNAALVFYWAELDRQIRIEGEVSRVSKEESAAYFKTRPKESRLAAWASKQSQAIENRAVLEEAYRELEAKYPDEQVPLPPFWGGFRLAPEAFEFWQNRPGRLHDRFRYKRLSEGGWLIERLSP